MKPNIKYAIALTTLILLPATAMAVFHYPDESESAELMQADAKSHLRMRSQANQPTQKETTRISSTHGSRTIHANIECYNRDSQAKNDKSVRVPPGGTEVILGMSDGWIYTIKTARFTD
jgi:hypothetical protein